MQFVSIDVNAVQARVGFKGPFTAAALAIAERTLIEAAADKRMLVSIRDAATMLGCGPRRVYRLIEAGELESLVDGASRRVVTGSLYDFIIRRAALSWPHELQPAKARVSRRRASSVSPAMSSSSR
jgi:excisionase family DNA binding protein